jgi:hypothetical protein
MDPMPDQDLKDTTDEWERYRHIMLFISVYFRAYAKTFNWVKDNQPTGHFALEK